MNRRIATTIYALLAALAPCEVSAQPDPVTLDAAKYSTGYCLIRPHDYIEEILRVEDAALWQTCAGAVLRSVSKPSHTKCSKSADVQKGDVIHVREVAGSNPVTHEFTLQRGTAAVLDRLPLQPGPNPLQPLWLSTEHDGFAYYLYLRDGVEHQGKRAKEFWLEAFDLTSKACLEELPSVPNVVATDCDELIRRSAPSGRETLGTLHIMESPVGPGPEYARAPDACDPLPSSASTSTERRQPSRSAHATPTEWQDATAPPEEWAKVDRDLLGDRFYRHGAVPIRGVNSTESFVTGKPVTLSTVPGGATCGNVPSTFDGASLRIRAVGASHPSSLVLRVNASDGKVLVNDLPLIAETVGADVVWLQTDPNDKKTPEYAVYLMDCSEYFDPPKGLGKVYMIERFESDCESHMPKFGKDSVERRFNEHSCATPARATGAKPMQTEVGVGPELR